MGDALGLPREGSIDWVLDVGDTLRIDADRDHLFRILSNLVRNALEALEGQREHAAPGHVPHGEIRIKAWREGRRVLVEVRDNGPGVPQKARDHLFEAFTGSQRKGGTGLGLRDRRGDRRRARRHLAACRIPRRARPSGSRSRIAARIMQASGPRRRGTTAMTGRWTAAGKAARPGGQRC